MSRLSKQRSRPYDKTEPKAVGDVISDLFAQRGYGRIQGDRQLQQAWQDVAGEEVAAFTRVVGLKNGVLQVTVSNSAMLAELASFRKQEFQEKFSEQYESLKIQDIKFKRPGQRR